VAVAIGRITASMAMIAKVALFMIFSRFRLDGRQGIPNEIARADLLLH